jgi:hypothetical protein
METERKSMSISDLGLVVTIQLVFLLLSILMIVY